MSAVQVENQQNSPASNNNQQTYTPANCVQLPYGFNMQQNQYGCYSPANMSNMVMYYPMQNMQMMYNTNMNGQMTPSTNYGQTPMSMGYQTPSMYTNNQMSPPIQPSDQPRMAPKKKKSFSLNATPEEGQTTLMIRNIPNKYTPQMLVDEWVEAGFGKLFNFFYLPIDFRTRCNVGYAFINFFESDDAERFKQYFTDYKLGKFRSHKILMVCPARVQGLESNIEHFKNSAVMSKGIENEFKPMLFDEEGRFLPFPAPDQPLPALRPRTKRVVM